MISYVPAAPGTRFVYSDLDERKLVVLGRVIAWKIETANAFGKKNFTDFPTAIGEEGEEDLYWGIQHPDGGVSHGGAEFESLDAAQATVYPPIDPIDGSAG